MSAVSESNLVNGFCEGFLFSGKTEASGLL